MEAAGEEANYGKDGKPQQNYPRFVAQTVRRRFPPGSEWLYAKLYTGVAGADYVLREVVRPVVEKAIGSGATDRWFFIRYGDPDWHLRLRFHGSPETLREGIIPALHETTAPLLGDGRIWRTQFDTYEREVERYGGAQGILLAEQLFHADSEAALEVVEMLEPGDSGTDERWRLTLYGIDVLLTDFCFDVASRLHLLKGARENLVREFHGDKRLRGQLSERYRKEREGLKALLTPNRDGEHQLSPGFDAFARRSEKLSPIVAALKGHEQASQLSVSLAELMVSYMHMQANRLLRSAQRRQELVIYDLLIRHYESRLARGLSSG